jgi:hypothetical protein
MLSGVLRSRTAVTVSIAIMRAFVELRRAAMSYDAIERRLTELERESRETDHPAAAPNAGRLRIARGHALGRSRYSAKQ